MNIPSKSRNCLAYIDFTRLYMPCRHNDEYEGAMEHSSYIFAFCFLHSPPSTFHRPPPISQLLSSSNGSSFASWLCTYPAAKVKDNCGFYCFLCWHYHAGDTCRRKLASILMACVFNAMRHSRPTPYTLHPKPSSHAEHPTGNTRCHSERHSWISQLRKFTLCSKSMWHTHTLSLSH